MSNAASLPPSPKVLSSLAGGREHRPQQNCEDRLGAGHRPPGKFLGTPSWLQTTSCWALLGETGTHNERGPCRVQGRERGHGGPLSRSQWSESCTCSCRRPRGRATSSVRGREPQKQAGQLCAFPFLRLVLRHPKLRPPTSKASGAKQPSFSPLLSYQTSAVCLLPF